MPLHQQLLHTTGGFQRGLLSMREEKMQPIIGNVLIGLGLALNHLLVCLLGHRTSGKECWYAIPRSFRDPFHLVHVLPSRGEDDGSTARGVEWGKPATSSSDLIFQRQISLWLVIVIILVVVYRTRLLLEIGIGIIENEIATLEFLAMGAQVQNTRVVIAGMSRLVCMKGDEISSPPPPPCWVLPATYLRE